MRPHQGRAEGKENLPRPAGHTLLDAIPKERPGKLIYRPNSSSSAGGEAQPGPLAVILKFIERTEGLR